MEKMYIGRPIMFIIFNEFPQNLSSSMERKERTLLSPFEFRFIVAVSISMKPFDNTFGVCCPLILLDFVNVLDINLLLDVLLPLNDGCLFTLDRSSFVGSDEY